MSTIIVNTLTFRYLKISFNIILPSMPRYLTWRFTYCTVVQSKCSSFPQPCYTWRPSHLRFKHRNVTEWRAQIMKLVLVQFPQSLSGQRGLLSILFSRLSNHSEMNKDNKIQDKATEDKIPQSTVMYPLFGEPDDSLSTAQVMQRRKTICLQLKWKGSERRRSWSR